MREMQIFVKLIVMREIKFRAKCCDLWVHGNLYIRKHEEFGDCAYIIGYTEKPSTTIVDINTIGQFTGLHDKNGKEIYEGDIVRYSLDGRKDVGYIGFHTRSASFRVIAEHTDFRIGNRGELHELNLEVIGNVHDNPELLQWKRQ